MTEDAGLISIVEGLVVDVAHFGSEYPDQRFYVGLEDPNAALLAVSRALKIGRGDSIQASRRLSKRHGRLSALVGVGFYEARIYCKAFAADEAGGDAGEHDPLEYVAQHIAIAEAPVPVLGERRVVGNAVVDVEPTEPAEGEAIFDLFAQPPLRADAIAVADNEHADEQLGIDRWSPGMAIVISQLMAQIGERSCREHIDAAQQMVGWHTLSEMKEPRVVRRLPPHHRQPPP